MRMLCGVVLAMVLVVAGCGGVDEGTIEDPSSLDEGSAATQGGGQSSANDEGGGGSESGGSQDSPTPESTNALPADSIRIGDTAWQRTLLDSGQCFVQEGDGATPFAVWGNLDNDETLRFSISDNADAGYEGSVEGPTMGWIAGGRDGTELTVEWDVAAQTISGEGLFYNYFDDTWAYGSFAFDCTQN